MGEKTRCAWAESHPLLTVYHDEDYGVTLETDADLFERLMLEVNQAGLSWLTILKKRDGFREAFDGFDIDRVADYGESERTRLLQDANIIRNRLKINAAIHNAKVVQSLRDEHGSFKHWLDRQTCESLEDWVKLFRATFKFMGPEIVNEFLMSTGYITITHDAGCWLNGKRAR
ncbi:MAG: DNA-3-methyladenine glycosylase I [Candidatus Latescibacteria bacterium]|jgi:DNA-3-methyladenine glycosylase I|nr:DNA-3-methyladenine glycosylase I [Candidatus Latescibacterota bacterium]